MAAIAAVMGQSHVLLISIFAISLAALLLPLGAVGDPAGPDSTMPNGSVIVAAERSGADMISNRFLAAIVTVVVGISSPLAGPGPAANEAPADPPPAPWGTSCTGHDRTLTLDCEIEQRVVLSNSGQLLTAVKISLPANASDPMMMIQTPFGLFLPAGLRLAVDGVEMVNIPLQTCDTTGCYAGMPVSTELLVAMQRGANLTVTFQDLQQSDIEVPVSLFGFSDAYERILG